jgi:nuclease S1
MECCGPNAVRLLLIVATLAALPGKAVAWGDDGHKTVALIAEHYLTPEAKRQVDTLLAADTDDLTRHDIANAATWADRFREANHRRDNYEATKRWHYVDLEIDDPDLNAACYGRRPLPPGTPASIGDNNPSVIDKIVQFAAELAVPETDAEERVIALKFLLRLVGDLHQPLHAADHHDAGGNKVLVTVEGFSHKARDELHGYWDKQFVEAVGRPPSALADQLIAQITPEQAVAWREGSVDDWAWESFNVAYEDVYGEPPLSAATSQYLDAAYVARAEHAVALQLSRAGVRLAAVLNRARGVP